MRDVCLKMHYMTLNTLRAQSGSYDWRGGGGWVDNLQKMHEILSVFIMQRHYTLKVCNDLPQCRTIHEPIHLSF